MITDRELLSLAAKAAGVYLVWNGDFPVEVFERWSGDPESQPDYYHQPWNPLTDDGDALRLAVSIPALDLHWVVAKAWQTFSIEEDRRAHVRRSIVSAAAEIGRRLP